MHPLSTSLPVLGKVGPSTGPALQATLQAAAMRTGLDERRPIRRTGRVRPARRLLSSLNVTSQHGPTSSLRRGFLRAKRLPENLKNKHCMTTVMKIPRKCVSKRRIFVSHTHSILTHVCAARLSQRELVVFVFLFQECWSHRVQ